MDIIVRLEGIARVIFVGKAKQYRINHVDSVQKESILEWIAPTLVIQRNGVHLEDIPTEAYVRIVRKETTDIIAGKKSEIKL